MSAVQPVEGVVTRKARRKLVDMLTERQGGLCAYCDSPITRERGPRLATLDHVLAVKQGGADDHSNLVVACWQCNRLKGCLTVAEIRRLADRIEALL